MQASVKIMDIDVDMMTNDVFIQKMNEYLNDNGLNVIFFASTELLNRAVEDPSYRELIEQADLFLPGEEALLSAHHVEVLEAGGMVVSCKSFGMMLENLQKEERSLYIIARNASEIEILKAWCLKMQPELRVVGSSSYDPEIEDDLLVNEINSHAPDMILVDLETGIQERWIIDHVAQLNASLCIAIGGVASMIVAQEKETPEWIKRLHLGGIYEKLVREQMVKKDVQARIFRKKVVQYNNQLEENDTKEDDYK